MFDSLGYAKKLEEVGIPREQAEAHVRIIADIVEGELATKADLTEAKNELRTEIAAVKAELKAEIAELRTETRVGFARIDHKMIELESRIMIKLGVMMITIVGASTSFLAFLLHK